MIAFGDVILFQNHREGHRPSPTMAYGIRCFKLQFIGQEKERVRFTTHPIYYCIGPDQFSRPSRGMDRTAASSSRSVRLLGLTQMAEHASPPWRRKEWTVPAGI